MPFMATQLNRRMPNVQANPAGGYSVAGIPNANEHAGIGLDQVQSDPTGAGSAMAYRNERFQAALDNMHAPLQNQQMPSLDDNMWGPWLQRLKENNVGKLQTSASAASPGMRALGQQPATTPGQSFGVQPGFFDTQHPAMQALQRFK